MPEPATLDIQRETVAGDPLETIPEQKKNQEEILPGRMGIISKSMIYGSSACIRDPYMEFIL